MGVRAGFEGRRWKLHAEGAKEFFAASAPGVSRNNRAAATHRPADGDLHG